MKPIRIVGLSLVVLGIVGLIWGGLSWRHRDTVFDAGPIKVTANKQDQIPIPPIAGAILLVAGIGVLMKRR